MAWTFGTIDPEARNASTFIDSMCSNALARRRECLRNSRIGAFCNMLQIAECRVELPLVRHRETDQFFQAIRFRETGHACLDSRKHIRIHENRRAKPDADAAVREKLAVEKHRALAGKLIDQIQRR